MVLHPLLHFFNLTLSGCLTLNSTLSFATRIGSAYDPREFRESFGDSWRAELLDMVTLGYIRVD